MYIYLYNMAKILRINKIQTTFFELTKGLSEKNKVNMLQQSEKHTRERSMCTARRSALETVRQRRPRSGCASAQAGLSFPSLYWFPEK